MLFLEEWAKAGVAKTTSYPPNSVLLFFKVIKLQSYNTIIYLAREYIPLSVM